VDGQLRLIEGLALPHEEDEFKLTYYNSNTIWISIPRLLALFELTREDLGDSAKVDAAVRAVAADPTTSAQGREEALGTRAGRRLPSPQKCGAT
jgi:hypothetical protein